MYEQPKVGERFVLNLRDLFLEAFDESLKGTPEFGERAFTYGKITWIGDGNVDLPGYGIDYYDWKSAPFERIPTDDGILELKVVLVDEDEDVVEAEQLMTFGMPHVRLTFDEYYMFAQPYWDE